MAESVGARRPHPHQRVRHAKVAPPCYPADPVAHLAEKKFRQHRKSLPQETEHVASSRRPTKPLLFAPPLMLEPRHSSPGAVRAPPNAAKSPLRWQPDEPAQVG